MRHGILLLVLAGIVGFTSLVHAQSERTPFQAAEQFVLAVEGDHNDADSEPGGASYRGVSRSRYDTWRQRHELPERSVTQMTPNERGAIYRRVWQDASCHKIARVDQRVALVVFDEAFNRQPSTAVETLQRSLNQYWSRSGGGQITVDGIWGPETKASLYHADTDGVIGVYLARREHWYRTETDEQLRRKNLNGWLNRLDRLEETVDAIEP